MKGGTKGEGEGLRGAETEERSVLVVQCDAEQIVWSFSAGSAFSPVALLSGFRVCFIGSDFRSRVT